MNDPRRPPILVTGSHRSGSTWVGKMLGAAHELHYVQEPFNVVAHQRWLSPRPPHQFMYLTDANGAAWERALQRIVELRYPLAAHLRERPDFETAKRMTRIALEARTARKAGAAALIKDPIALFSTLWLRARFDVDAVVLVRDPVSFVGSLKKRNWTFDFRHWTAQPALMTDLLGDYEQAIRAACDESADIIDQGILQWNVFYSVVDRFRRDDPGVMVVNYNRLASNPLVEVEQLYRRLHLDFGTAQRLVVDDLTTGRGSVVSPVDVRRSSGDALQTWKSRLTTVEVDRIRRGTTSVAALFSI